MSEYLVVGTIGLKAGVTFCFVTGVMFLVFRVIGFFTLDTEIIEVEESG